MHQNAFGGRPAPGPAVEAYRAPPDRLPGLKGEGRGVGMGEKGRGEGRGRKGEMEKEKGGPPPPMSEVR